VIAVAIESQAIPATREDWRAYRWDVDADFPPHLPFRIEAELEERCVGLVGSYGLGFGAIDLVQSSDGEMLFLELNPNGQWAWIEQRTGLPMARAPVDVLTTNQERFATRPS